MNPTETRGATNKYERPANWNAEKNGECGDLMVRVDTYGADQIIECISTWKPTAGELRKLNAGGVIEIGLSIPNQCVMRAYVVDPVVSAKPVERHVVINEHAHGDDYEADKDWAAEQDRG